MAAVLRAHPPSSPGADGLLVSLTRLAQLELELGIAETKQTLIAAAIRVAVALVAAIALVAALVVLLAAAFAPVFAARWEHLVIAGGAVALASAGALTWSALGLRALDWPHQTLASLEENRRWLAAQLKSRLTSR